MCRIVLTSWLVVVLVVLAGCRSAPPSAPQAEVVLPETRAAMQVGVYTGQYDVVFGATIDVLQELSWRLDSVDKSAGIILASTVRGLESLGPEDEKSTDLKVRRAVVRRRADITQKWSRWHELIIHTEPWGAGLVRQRIVLNLRGALPAMSYSEREDGGVFTKGRSVVINAPPEEQSVEVSVPEAYGDFFDRIRKAVRARETP